MTVARATALRSARTTRWTTAAARGLTGRRRRTGTASSSGDRSRAAARSPMSAAGNRRAMKNSGLRPSRSSRGWPNASAPTPRIEATTVPGRRRSRRSRAALMESGGTDAGSPPPAPPPRRPRSATPPAARSRLAPGPHAAPRGACWR